MYQVYQINRNLKFKWSSRNTNDKLILTVHWNGRNHVIGDETPEMQKNGRNDEKRGKRGKRLLHLITDRNNSELHK